MGVPTDREAGQLLLHLMTGETLPEIGAQGARGRIASGERRYWLGELVAHDTVQVSLAAHLAELDLGFVGEMTAVLHACGVGREEAVCGASMAGETFHLAFESR
jgi:hypothetical protein